MFRITTRIAEHRVGAGGPTSEVQIPFVSHEESLGSQAQGSRLTSSADAQARLRHRHANGMTAGACSHALAGHEHGHLCRRAWISHRQHCRPTQQDELMPVYRRNQGSGPTAAEIERALDFAFPPDFEPLYRALAAGNAFGRSPLFALIPFDQVKAGRQLLNHPDLVPVLYDREGHLYWAWRMPTPGAGVLDVATAGQFVVFDPDCHALTPLGPSFLNVIRALLVDAEARATEFEHEAAAVAGVPTDLAERAAVIRAWVAMMLREHRMLAIEPPQSIPRMPMHGGPFEADESMAIVTVGPMSDAIREEIPAFEAAVAQNHFAAGMVQLARARWLRAIECAPDCVSMHWGLAITFSALGAGEEAAWHHLAVVEGDWTMAAGPSVGPEPLWTANVFGSLASLRPFLDRGLKDLASSQRVLEMIRHDDAAIDPHHWRSFVQDLIARGQFGRARQVALAGRARLNRPGEAMIHPEFSADDLLQQIYFALGLPHRLNGLDFRA